MNLIALKIELETKILRFCKDDYKSLGDIAEKFNRNKNTIRAGYLYPLVKRGLLIKSTQYPFKSTTKYKTAKGKA